MKQQIESTLASITDKVYGAKTADEAIQAMVTYLSESKIKEEDKRTMIETVSSMDRLAKVQQYFTNCLLKYEGHSYSKL